MCTEYKYLGVWFDNKLNWNTNTTNMCSKANQRLYFLRKLRSYNVGRDTLFLFYQSTIQSVITFCCIVWFMSLSGNDLTQLNRIRKSAVKVIGTDVKDLKSICEKFMNNKLSAIRDDVTHPLNKYITVSRSGRLVTSKKKQIDMLTLSCLVQFVLSIIYSKDSDLSIDI